MDRLSVGLNRVEKLGNWRSTSPLEQIRMHVDIIHDKDNLSSVRFEFGSVTFLENILGIK